MHSCGENPISSYMLLDVPRSSNLLHLFYHCRRILFKDYKMSFFSLKPLICNDPNSPLGITNLSQIQTKLELIITCAETFKTILLMLF